MEKYDLLKKPLTLVLALTLLALSLVACGEEATPPRPGSTPESTWGEPESELVIIDEAPLPGIDVDLPEMELLVDEAGEGGTIQVPQFVATTLDDDIETLNAEMLAFAGNYQDYIGGHPDDYELTLKAWYSRDSAWSSILMLQSHIPVYGTYGNTAVFIYDFWQGRAVPLQEQADIYTEESTVAREALWAGEFLEDDGQFVSDVVFKGCFNGTLLYDVTVSRGEKGTDWVYLYGVNVYLDGEVEMFDKEALLEYFSEEY